MINSYQQHEERWTRQLKGWELKSCDRLYQVISGIRLSDLEDEIIWLGYNASWNSKDAYNLIEGDKVSNKFWQVIWKLKLPTRIKLFMWKPCKGILPVRDLLSKSGIHINNSCLLCKKEA